MAGGVSFQGLGTGFTNRISSGGQPVLIGGHPIEDMVAEATKLYHRQLETLVRAGCIECGDPVAVIAYPPDWEVQLIENGRLPGVSATRGLEIRVRVRLLCGRCAETKELW